MSINSRTEKKVATAASFQQEEEEEEGKKILKHLEKHLHVTNCIHISNHLHMQKKKKRNSSSSSPTTTTTTMLDTGRKAASSSSPHELPLIRELTAVKKKVKALRDPPATAYSSPNIYETEVDFTENRAGRGGHRGDGVLQPQLLAGRRIATQRNRLLHDDGSGVCSAKSTPTATTNRTWVDDPDDDDDDDGEAEEMGTRRRRRTRGFVGDQEDDHHHHQSPQWRRHQQLQYKGGGEEGCGNSSRLGRRRGMKASRCAEGGSSLEDDTDKNVVAAAPAAMRFKCRQNGHLSSSPHASSQPRGDASSSTAAAAAKSPLMCTSTTTTTEEPPPTKYKRSRTTTRRGLPDASSRKLNEDDVNPKRLGIHSRGRIRNPRAAVHHTTTRGQTESPEAAATAPHPPPHDARELSEMIPQQQQQGCGIPWYQSRAHKGKKGKRLLDFAGMGFTCAFPEAMMKKKVMDSKKQQQQASGNNVLGGSLRYHEVVAATAPSMSPAAAAATPVTTTIVVGEGAQQQSTLLQLDSGANEARILVNREEEQTLDYEEQEEEQEEGKHTHECTYDDDDDDDDDDNHIGTPGMDSRIEKSPSACDLLSDSGLICSSGRIKAHNNIRHQDDGNGMGYSKASPCGEQYDDLLSRETLMHQSLSHKYRPKSFKDLVGQTLVVKALTTAITKGKIAPLYLFAGPHGTGKTSTARIFAAAVICHNTEPHRRPCGLCRECTTLTLNNTSSSSSSSSSHYVKEIDASNLELDHMRSVLHRMSLLSQSNSHHHHHHRVFIVECCEALSAEAWNTFLKFLDDPPRNMVFILITSDLEHLPLAATSRCQKFSFGRLKEMEIVTRLQFLATKDALEVDEAALLLIAARANGSLHDAETTLDQLSLLDRKVSLAMVEELVGLVSDKKLLELLDFALSANTTNTVRCLRELLDSGVDALSLVAQLASLITNILAGTSDVHSEMKGFSKRNFSKKEQQQRLRQALKVLAESEKQLRVSNDRPTWLTAALLQFAPDRSYLPSSVDTSMTPSPIAFDTFEKITAAEAYTPRIQTSGDWILDTQKSQSSHQVVLTPKLPPTAIVEEKKERAAQQQTLCATTTTSHSEGKKKLPSGGKQSEAKVHPAESPMEKAGKSPLVATTSQLGSIVLFDGGRVAESRNFQVLGCRELEDVWVKVLHGCRSNVLRQLLQAHGTLISLCIAKDNSYAVSHVEFQHVEQKARAERLRSSTCHAFQMALGCPVELKLSLSCPPTTVTEDSKTLHAMESTADSEAAAGPSNTTVHIFTENSCSLSARQMQEALLGDQQQRQFAKKNQQHHGGLVGHTCVMNPDYVDQAQVGRHQGHGYSPALENNPSEEVPQDVLEVLSRQKFRQKASHKSSTATTQPNGHLEKSDESCTQTKSKQEKAAKHKSSEFKGIISIEQETLKLQSRIKSSRRPLCWKSSPPRKLKGKPNHRRSQKRVAFFFRMVPCTRSRIK